MVIDWIIVLLALTALIAGSITDFKKREVSDWLSYSLMFAGVGLSIFKWVATEDVWFFIFSLIGFGLMFLVSLVMFYTGQWGGGDAKVLMGLGALFGSYTPLFATNFHSELLPNFLQGFAQYNPLFLFILLLNIAIMGSLYGFVWTFVLAIVKRKTFAKEYVNQATKNKKIRYSAYTIAAIFLLIGSLTNSQITKIITFFFGLLIAMMITAHTYVKTIETVAMVKNVNVSDITEGEWIVYEVFDKKKKYICGPKDLGISSEQIAKLKENNIKKIIIKVGIPFIPAFLIGFIVTILFSNVILTLYTLIA